MVDYMQGIITIVIIIVIAVIAIILIKWLIGMTMLAPLTAYGAESGSDKAVDKAVIQDNDTKITVTCTENIEGLVESCTD